MHEPRTYDRPVRALAAALLAAPAPIGALVSASGLPRRRVEELLRGFGPDVVEDRVGWRLRPEVREEYRVRFRVEELAASGLDDPVGRRVAGGADLVASLAELIAARPAPLRDLDHVGATAETLARRAWWLDASYELAGSRLLCVGDHDLTSLAVAAVNPDVEIVVADVDERILGYLDAVARQHGWPIRCVWADFRLRLPVGASGWADLVFTDPPYTPEGVETFLLAGLAGLRDRERGRLVMAYGYGEHQPTLGLKVQQAVLGLHLAFEAILPGFNRYSGAEAIGSRADLYVCRPTARTWRALPTLAERQPTRLYTHGRQSLESDHAGGVPLDEVAAALGAQPDLVVGDRWRSPAQRSTIAGLLAGGVPRQLAARPVRAVLDLTQVPHSWLLRALLATNAARLAVAVVQDQPIDGLITAKYRVRRLPAGDPRYALLVLDAAAEASPVAAVLARSHGKLGNIWREALVAAGGLSKNEARAVIERCARRPDALGSPLLELPRTVLGQVLADIERSAELLGG